MQSKRIGRVDALSEYFNRRHFLALTGASAAWAVSGAWRAMAGPFEEADFNGLIPADKKLSPEWIKSLFEKGQRETYRGADLEKIGLPIGGIGAGQLYLGGDGKLWHWDIFNQHIATSAEHYAKPLRPSSPLDQGFALSVTIGKQSQVRPLDRSGWSDISFTGEYPIGYVEYRDPDCPVSVSLEAFSPFIPLNPEESGLPATVMSFTLKNTSAKPVTAELAGWLENAVCRHSARLRHGRRRNEIIEHTRFLLLNCGAEDLPLEQIPPPRPDIAFEDFEKETYEGWKVAGTAFGAGPVEKAKMPAYQGEVGAHGQRLVNSHHTRAGEDVAKGDAHLGTLTSKAFVIERHYITFLIGGGGHKDKTCMNLLVDDQVVLSATGANNNRMQPVNWDVRAWQGKTGRLQIVDNAAGPWGNVGVDHIVFSDLPRGAAGALKDERDFGTMGLALLKNGGGKMKSHDFACTALPTLQVPGGLFSESPAGSTAPSLRPFGQKLSGSLTRRLVLPAGQSAIVTFVLVWHFPNHRLSEPHRLLGRRYAARFASAQAVAEHVAANFDSLARQTRLWHDTWYDSTLPWWFLNRTFANTSILASSTCHWLADGRFYGWEGVGCCAGTCGHVWQYAQAVGRLFPQLERDIRQRVDFGLALMPNGAIRFRGEFNNSPAVDGQAGTILRALREHQMSADANWLKANWPKIKLALQWLMDQDANGDGLIEGGQHNTLDADWHGPVAWLSGLYLAALRAGEEMANDLADETFARQCRAIFDKGVVNIVEKLFDQEYFINRPDPKKPEAINSGTGCHIDQVFGQSWAFQVGLGRVFPEKETLSALRSLWRYNFTPDVGPYREANRPGRWYAMPGEGGLLMCSFPRPDWNYAKAKGKGADWAAGYFNECMNGFEYQVAGHMLWEGLLMEGLAIARMVHDRYHPSRRNPWNEVECGDHYARSMASYGVFLAACGFEYHGPKGRLGFAPRLTPENFRAPFTAAEGWGAYSQKAQAGRFEAAIEVRWGRLKVQTLALRAGEGMPAGARARIALNGRELACQSSTAGRQLIIQLAEPALLEAGQKLDIVWG